MTCKGILKSGMEKSNINKVLNGNNPVMFVDPLGLADYIFYTDDAQEDAANNTKKQLMDSGVPEDEIFLIQTLNAVDIMSAKAKHPDSIYEMLKELGII